MWGLPTLSRLRSLWRNLVHRDGVERDLDDEVRSVFELLVEEKVDAGMTQEAARRAAAIELGQAEAIKDRVRDVRAGAVWDAFRLDLRHGIGITSALGRLLSVADDRPAQPVAVLSHAYWQRRFGGREDVLGSAISLNRVPFTVVGVEPPGFLGTELGRRYDFSVPKALGTI